LVIRTTKSLVRRGLTGVIIALWHGPRKQWASSHENFPIIIT